MQHGRLGSRDRTAPDPNTHNYDLRPNPQRFHNTLLLETNDPLTRALSYTHSIGTMYRQGSFYEPRRAYLIIDALRYYGCNYKDGLSR